MGEISKLHLVSTVRELCFLIKEAGIVIQDVSLTIL